MSRSPPGVGSPPRSIAVDSSVSYFLSPPLIISIPKKITQTELVRILQTFIDQNRDKRTEYTSIRNLEFAETETNERCIHLPRLYFGPKRNKRTVNPLEPMDIFIFYFWKIPKTYILFGFESLQSISKWDSEQTLVESLKKLSFWNSFQTLDKSPNRYFRLKY